MRTLRWLVPVAACLMFTSACSHSRVEGSSGLDVVPPSAGVSVPGVPLPSPGPSSSSHPPAPHPTAPSKTAPATSTYTSVTLAPPPSSPAPSDDPGLPVLPFPSHPLKIPSDYAIYEFNACSWLVSNGVVRITAVFNVTYAGLLPKTDISYDASENAESNTTSGTIQSLFINSEYPISLGAAGQDDFAGKTVTVTATIHPNRDTNSANNTASQTMHVPAEAVSTNGDTTQHMFTC